MTCIGLLAKLNLFITLTIRLYIWVVIIWRGYARKSVRNWGWLTTGWNPIDSYLTLNRLTAWYTHTHTHTHTHSNCDLNDCDVRIRNTPITFVKSAKFLGITIDDRLNYNEHVTQLTKRLSRCKGNLYKLSYSIPPTILRQLYFAIFYSVMIYGIAYHYRIILE